MKKLLLLVLGATAGAQVFAHGWQTYPLSRTEYQKLQGMAPVVWEPQSVAANLTGGGGSDYDGILNYHNGGALGFFKAFHPAQGRNICSQGGGRWSSLDTPIPEAHMTTVNYGQDLQFKWTYTAWHQPSNMFVFITNYKGTQYNANPTWNDLTLLCSVPISTKSDTGSWKCKLPTIQGAEKQVLVTVWQRQDAAGENFISCSDVKFKGGTPIKPEEIWSPITTNAEPWLQKLGAVGAGQLVTFELYQKNKAGVTSTLATYSLSVTKNNKDTWDSILAKKINEDTTITQVVAVGKLNAKEGTVTYDSADQTQDFVYLNNTLADPSMTYSYKISKKKDPNPVVNQWTPTGQELKFWLGNGNIKAGDKLLFSLNIAGVEQTIEPVEIKTAANVKNVEKLMVQAINKHVFNDGLKVKAGVLEGTQVKFVDGGANRVYIHKASDDTTYSSYVIRNGTTPISKYKIYPDGLGSYKAGEIVMDGSNGKTYSCKYVSWCNSKAYPLNSDAWMVYDPKPVPVGYETYKEGTTYSKNQVVAGTDGNLYECIQPGWCSGAAWAYAPGTGSAWTQAWAKK